MYQPYEYVVPSLDQTKDNKYKKFVREMTGNPKNGAPRPFDEKLNAFYSRAEARSSVAVGTLPDLLKTNFIVGENHCDRAPKSFLIQNMHKLKEAGYTTLFLEHLYYDDQEELDDYDPDSSWNAKKKQKMETRISRLDHDFKDLITHELYCPCKKCSYPIKNNYLELVKAAKRCGIRVVGIDTEYTYSEQYDSKHMEYVGGPTAITQDTFRLRSMNYTASKIIEKETKDHPGKWFALIGYDHCSSSEDVIDVPQLTGATTVLVSSEEKLKKVKVGFNGVVSIQEKISWGGAEMRTVNIPYAVRIEAPVNQSIPVIEGTTQIEDLQTQSKFNQGKSKREEQKERFIKELPMRCESQIKRFNSLPKIFNNPHAMEKRRILETAQEILDKDELTINDRLSAFRDVINKNRAILTRPHSTIPKDIMKGLLVFVASTLLVIPGILLGIRFFSPHRSTTTEEQIIKPLDELMP
ncbi:membrane-targeted effector domain-containing toxin [Fluoribacter gormanii]|uniref:membrane-targeted effector domain-containing toxin n=1 Tax=Fluoribacter gormanii TaxID=464 RepID=UPI0010414F6F|nr:membrane-targeted effector domain-containing toxin [Fluoribacter gormanii]